MPIENAKTVERAARLLFELAGRPEGMSATELAARLDTQRPPLYRLLQTLTEYRLIHRDRDKRYALGVGVLELAHAVQAPLDWVAGPVLQAVADRLGVTAMLALVQDDDLVTAVSASPRTGLVQISSPVGFRHPSAGESPDGAPRIALRAGSPAVDGEPAEVARARTRGYAVGPGVAYPGRTFAAAPVLGGARGPLGCVVLVSLDPQEESVLGSAAGDAAGAISTGLGHRAR